MPKPRGRYTAWPGCTERGACRGPQCGGSRLSRGPPRGRPQGLAQDAPGVCVPAPAPSGCCRVRRIPALRQARAGGGPACRRSPARPLRPAGMDPLSTWGCGRREPEANLSEHAALTAESPPPTRSLSPGAPKSACCPLAHPGPQGAPTPPRRRPRTEEKQARGPRWDGRASGAGVGGGARGWEATPDAEGGAAGLSRRARASPPSCLRLALCRLLGDDSARQSWPCPFTGPDPRRVEPQGVCTRGHPPPARTQVSFVPPSVPSGSKAPSPHCRPRWEGLLPPGQGHRTAAFGPACPLPHACAWPLGSVRAQAERACVLLCFGAKPERVALATVRRVLERLLWADLCPQSPEPQRLRVWLCLQTG